MINRKRIWGLTLIATISFSMTGCKLFKTSSSSGGSQATTTENVSATTTSSVTTTEDTTEEVATSEAASTEEADVHKGYNLKDEIKNGSIEDLKIQICDDIIPLGSMITVKEFLDKYPDYRFAKKNGESMMVKAIKEDEFCVHDKVEVQNDKLGTSFYLYVLHPGIEDASVMDCSVVTIMEPNKTARESTWYSGGYKYNEAINDESLFPGYTPVDYWKDDVTVGTYSYNGGSNHHIVEGKDVNIYGVKPIFKISVSTTGHRLNDLINPYYADIKAYVTPELINRYVNVLRDKD